MVSGTLYRRYYPDDSRSGTLEFYRWVREHVDASTLMLNLGAGPSTRNPVRSLRGEVAKVVGADIDPVVLENDELDEAVVLHETTLPFPDECFHVVLSDYVLEHVEDPETFLGEVRRVLKSRGSFFFRTPNKYHYVALLSRLTPHRVHKLVANRARGLSPGAHPPWPTFYRLNSRHRLVKAARRVGFAGIDLRLREAEPSYLVRYVIPFLLGVAYERVVNRFETLAVLRSNIFGRLVR